MILNNQTIDFRASVEIKDNWQKMPRLPSSHGHPTSISITVRWSSLPLPWSVTRHLYSQN